MEKPHHGLEALTVEELHQQFSQHLEEFNAHLEQDKLERRQQQELREAIFRKEDLETNTPPGLLQLTLRLNKQLREMLIWQDRQKTFVGAVVIVATSFWFLLTEVGTKLFKMLKGF